MSSFIFANMDILYTQKKQKSIANAKKIFTIFIKEIWSKYKDFSLSFCGFVYAKHQSKSKKINALFAHLFL